MHEVYRPHTNNGMHEEAGLATDNVSETEEVNEKKMNSHSSRVTNADMAIFSFF
jgi:hypothetical protein